MIRLLAKVILPVIEAADAKSILEIGAESGTSTRLLLRYVTEKKGHLFCIDPAPEFDVGELQTRYPERFTFYRDTSLNVLREHQEFDVALVDGDHNWYTVYNELKQIEKIHNHDPMTQPIIIAHDIGWPYGRRDLYYEPSRIPEPYRQPHEKKGILLNKSSLSAESGINENLWNATHEGGPRNGVLTAIEDYLSNTRLEFEFINLPLYFGLGILITKERLKSAHRLQEATDKLKIPGGSEWLLQLAEHLRCVEATYLAGAERLLRSADERITKLEDQMAKMKRQSKTDQHGGSP